MLYCDMNKAFDQASNDSIYYEQPIKYTPSPTEPKISYYMHKCYVKEFLKSLEGRENFSVTSDNFDHVKTCKICKAMIKNKMSKKEKSYQPTSVPVPSAIEHFSEAKNKILDNISFLNKSEYKSILIIILIGIILIIVVDLFVRIGRKSGKL
jgi:hypothetical protein